MTSEPPAKKPLIDGQGRTGNDLRISVTDRCNLRCLYCMPHDGMDWLPRAELLSFEEIERIAGLFVDLGVDKIRITGGEPLVRHDLPKLVAKLASLDPRPELALTTNGVLLADSAEALVEAGLDRVNVSLDSLRDDRFKAITRRDDLDRALAGLEAAKAVGLDPVKVNCVVMRGTNDDEIVDFARFADDHGYVVRFIEYMPLDEDGRWRQEDVFGAEEMIEALEAAGISPKPIDIVDPDPADRFSFDGDGSDDAPAEIGFIASVTAPFCATCNRLRITSDGSFHSCLFALESLNLRDMVRAGASDAEIESAIRGHFWKKWPGHRIGKPDFIRPEKSMSQLGG